MRNSRKRKKSNFARIICYAITLCIVGSSYFVGEMMISVHFEEENTVQAAAMEQVELKLQTAIEEKEAKLAADEAARIEAERIEAERIEAERIEAERIEAERKEAARVAAEKKRAAELEAQKKREEAAKAEAQRKEVIAAEKAKAAAEKAERQRISAKIKAQEANALAEQAEYDALQPTPIVKLEVENIFQKPDLPNGCEVTSLSILMKYKGYGVSKTQLADSYLPKFPFYTVGEDEQRAGGDPNYYFAGDPRNVTNSYYCFAGPIVSAGNILLSSFNDPQTAKDITGTGEQGLTSQLDAGNPVIVWGTLSMGDAFTFAPNAWIINENGDKHIPFLNLHCVVLTGYDENFFYFADPLRGNVVYKRSTFMNAYNQIGSRAVVVS